jgi:RNA 2',3'-cyclic 3'-phosphodiesterase
MMHRIFLAVNLPAKAKAELLGPQEQRDDLSARWTRPENMHLTLVFLGNTSDAELEETKRVAKEVALRHKPFSFLLSKIVYGPSPKQPRMIWATGETPKELLSLHKDLANALQQKEEHLFSLHITLARMSEWEFRSIDPEERPEINQDISFEVPVSSFEIMESKLGRGGAKYSVIESIPLKT